MIEELRKQLEIIKEYMAFVERTYMDENEQPYDNWENVAVHLMPLSRY